MSAAPACRVVLVGMMGSGKTTLGRLLAARTGWGYLDNDQLLTQATGRSARQLLEDGAAALRTAEAAALRAGLAAPAPVIVAAAGGVVLDEDNRRELRDGGGVVVWLRARPRTLARRASGAAHRPWLDEGAFAWTRDAVAEREALYADVADMALDTDGVAPEAAVERLLGQLRATSCGPWLASVTARALPDQEV